MAQSKTIQLLRSSQLYTPSGEGANAKTALENAKAALTGLTGRKDGEIVLARYQEATGPIKSVLGIYHANPDLPSGSAAGWTFIQDVTESQGSAAALQAEIDAIEVSVGLGTDGSYTSGYSSDEIVGSPTTLKATVDAIVSFIKGLDKAADAVNGQVVTTVTQVNGAVTETKANVKDLQLGGYSKEANVELPISSTDTVNTAFSKLENSIAKNTVSSANQTILINTSGNTTDLAVNIDGTTLKQTSGVISSDLKILKETTNLEANVKEQYKLVYGSDTTAIGDTIKVYKDSALLSVKLLHATDSLKPSYDKATDTWTDIASASQTEANVALCYAYENASGTVVVEAIPVGDFLRESEFKNGLQVNNGEVSVKIDSTSGKVTTAQGVQSDVLTVSANGIKVDNIQAAIDYAVQNTTSGLDAEVTSSDGTNVQVKVTEVDGVITAVNITTDNTVNSTDVSNAITTAIGALDADLDASGTAQHNGTFVMSGVTEVDGVLTAVDSVEVEAAGAAAAAKATIDAYTVNTKAISTNPVLNGADIALTGYSKGSDATAVSANDTVNAAVGKLENQIANVKTTADGALQSVSSGNGAIAVGTEDANHDQSISLVLNSGSNEMLTIENGGLNLSTSWDCGTF